MRFFHQRWAITSCQLEQTLRNWKRVWKVTIHWSWKLKHCKSGKPGKLAVEKKAQRGKTGWSEPAPRGVRKFWCTHQPAPREQKPCSGTYRPAPRGGKKYVQRLSSASYDLLLRSTSSLPNKVNNTHMWHKCSTNNVPKSLQSTHHAVTSNLALYAKLPPRIDCDPYATARLCVTCCHLSSSQLAIFQRQKANFHFTEQKYQYWYLLQTEHVNVNILHYQKIDCDSLSCLVVGKLGWKCKISHQKRTKGFSDFFQTLLCKKSRTSHSRVRSQIYAGHKKPLDQAGWGQGQLWEFCDIVWTFMCGLILVSFYRGKICKMWQFIDHKFKMSHGSFMQKLHFGTRHYGIQSIHVLLIEKK